VSNETPNFGLSQLKAAEAEAKAKAEEGGLDSEAENLNNTLKWIWRVSGLRLYRTCVRFVSAF
jgi:hypothetical protein